MRRFLLLSLWFIAAAFATSSRNPPRPTPLSGPIPPPEEVESAPGIEIHETDGVARITKHRRPANVDAAKCCWESFFVAWAPDGAPIVVTTENFLCDPEAMVREAILFDTQKRWNPADIHLDHEYKGSDPLEVTAILNSLAFLLTLTAPSPTHVRPNFAATASLGSGAT